MKLVARVSLLTGFAIGSVVPALAQAPSAPEGPPAILTIFREEVKPGKDAAHEANETGWPAAYARAKSTYSSLAMTSVSGPTEAWYLSGYGSWEEWEKRIKAEDANEALSAETRKLWAQDGEMLNRASQIVAAYRPAISYRARANLASFRYMQVRLIRVKQGRAREFLDSWRETVAAHEKANMDEGFAFYQVVSGLQDGTYLYLQAFPSMADIDKSGPMHNTSAYRDAAGEACRARSRDAAQVAIEWSQTVHFAFNPKMSYVPKAWMDADPFWAPKPVVAPKPAEKKK